MLSGTSDVCGKILGLARQPPGLSFKGSHGMVTLEFLSGNQASFEGNPA